MHKDQKFYAHSLEGQPPENWEPLEAHLSKVGDLAAQFASAFGAAEWGRALGEWHDLGKYSQRFQQYLASSNDPDASERDERPSRQRIDHSTFGARHAVDVIGGHRGQLLAFCIAGHHAGLPNTLSTDVAAVRSTLRYRLDPASYPIPTIDPQPTGADWPKLTVPFRLAGPEAGFQAAFFTRMLFSALIDADRLCTEGFCDPARAAERAGAKPTLAEMHHGVSEYLKQKQAEADPTPVNRARARVLSDCVAAADMAPGFFSLTVPTGGGKTLSSLAFALGHALAHDLRRVVVAVPFTTIIEQTADEYRKALGPLAERGLIEHHSNIRPEVDTRQNKLAAENWDAPLIVTTNVQLYEGLFSSAATPCRKLHRLAHSVIVLDEAQTIPVELLQPTLLALRELVDHYGCTVVLCTATQPALERREGFDIGIYAGSVRPIVRGTPQIFAALDRVRVLRLGRKTDEELAELLAREPAVLCIVNTRAHAARLYDAVAERCPGEGCFHLSTLMCAQHRREVLAAVRKRLKEGKSCRLVSTQLIEAGVDIDFPAVYRAPAGFDSFAQAAGRCNREGLLEAGRLYLFDAETQPPAGLLRSAAQTGLELAAQFEDPIAPDAIEAYFRQYYWSQQHNWDRCDVLGSFGADPRERELRLQFREASSRYKIIREEHTPVLVPYDGKARAMRDALLRGGPADFMLLRGAQRYIVGVWRNALSELAGRNLVIEHEKSGLWLLVNEHAYTPEKGLSAEAAGIDAGLLIG